MRSSSPSDTTLLQVIPPYARRTSTRAPAKELVAVARETLEDQNKHLLQVRGFVQVGTQPDIAFAQQKASVANAHVQFITAQNGYETAKAQLNQAAGFTGGTDYDVANEDLPAVEDEDQPLECSQRRRIATRPELTSLQRARFAQEATLCPPEAVWSRVLGERQRNRTWIGAERPGPELGRRASRRRGPSSKEA